VQFRRNRPHEAAVAQPQKGFVVQHSHRLKAGIVERLAAVKPAIISEPTTSLDRH